MTLEIDYKNISVVNSRELHIHDSVFTGFHYDYDNKEISFFTFDDFYNKKYTFSFHGVLIFEMQACEFWGGSWNVSSWWAPEENDCILKEKVKSLQSQPSNSYRDDIIDLNKYIETRLQLISGDDLRILCKRITFIKDPYSP